MLQWMELGTGSRSVGINIVTVLVLCVASVTLAFDDDFSPTSLVHLSHIEMLQYLVKNNNSSSQGLPPATGLYAFLSVQLNKPSHIQLRGAVLGFSTDQCQETVLARAPLNLWDTSSTVTSPVLVPLDGVYQVLGRLVDVCLRTWYINGEEEVFTGWKRQMKKFTFPFVSPENLGYDEIVGEPLLEKNSFPLEIESLENEEVSSFTGQDIPDVLQRERREEAGGNQTDFEGEVKIFAILLDKTSSKQKYNEDGVIMVFEEIEFTLHLVGVNMEKISKIKFTTVKNHYGGPCGDSSEAHFQSQEMPVEMEDPAGFAIVLLPGDANTGLAYHPADNTYYLCVKEEGSEQFVHQGGEHQLQVQVTTSILPVWLMIVLLVVLLAMSGLFSGLNLGLMSLDQTELKIVMSTGSDTEKDYAKAIMPVRGMGNFLLCSILLGNVLVNNTLTILLDILTGGGGTVAVICATLGIVVFGEIIPQAICSRHGLAVGAKTIWLTKFFMLITSPLSFPISIILDKILGSEIGTVYDKVRLMELLKVTDQYNDLEKDEVNIVTGALVLKQKTVKDIMTHIDDCYMLPLDSVLNFKTVSEIKDQGYSRIPVYNGERTNIVNILFTKDLLFIDPDDDKPLKEVCKFYSNEVNTVYDDTILTDMFDEFKSGEKGHMAIVQEVNSEGDGDPFYETIGLVTIEDIIEEIIQQEIIDETDIVMDNKSKKKRKRGRCKQDAELKMFLGSKNCHRMMISPQMSLAILQFLTTSVRAFSAEICGQRILQEMLRMDVYREIKLTKVNKGNLIKDVGQSKSDDSEGIIMRKGEACDFFVLIVEGHVEVIIGREGHKFQEGPFSCFGEQMLEQALVSPSSPMVSLACKGPTHSLSLHSSSSQEGKLPTLFKAPSILQQKTDVKGIRSVSADAGHGAPLFKSNTWVPDYTLRAVSDVLYLKIRRSTYMVAVNATKMNSNQTVMMKDEDLEKIFAEATNKSLGNLVRSPPSLHSPDITWEEGIVQNMLDTTTDTRRASVRSSMSNIRCKIVEGRSTSSLDRSVQGQSSDVTLAFDDGSTEHSRLVNRLEIRSGQVGERDHMTLALGGDSSGTGPVASNSPSDRTSLLLLPAS
eukprot:GFUD01019031.1.p1 GENE.GFUD01019031.1~~GFUD01019031.1.p1  ORF type:complete len:1105 (+),score=307.53 GFUD01019031.1:114-3428(+)